MNAFQTVFLLAVGLSVAHSLDYKALHQFRKMIICLMPDSWPALDYADYGCYCGWGGSGTPVDDLDRCCQVHDQCYSDSMQHPECWPILDNPYTEFYDYTCDESNKRSLVQTKIIHVRCSSVSATGKPQSALADQNGSLSMSTSQVTSVSNVVCLSK